MAEKKLTAEILAYLKLRAQSELSGAKAADITAKVKGKRATVNRYLATMLAQGLIVQEGGGPATSYRIAKPSASTPMSWSAKARHLRGQLEAPIGVRNPVGYQRQFVDDYQPNHSSLLPTGLADSLFKEGRSQGQQPASTYARKVLEMLLIDLSWHSSRLEGNRKSLLDTRELFAKGRSANDDQDATMLLNHKESIEFMVDAVPEYGITAPVVRNIQSLLMQGLLDEAESIGAIRKRVVNIADSVYVPTQIPSLLEEMLKSIVDKTRSIKNPVEAAFYMWVNIAYLQPFEDGNKRTSRLCANLPLMLSNCAPLSFLDVDRSDYAISVMGVYERLDLSMAVELFEWTYKRSIAKYQVILESMGPVDPFRATYREPLGHAVRQVVSQGAKIATVLEAAQVAVQDQTAFLALLQTELLNLEIFNCARYRLTMGTTENWINRGRPM